MMLATWLVEFYLSKCNELDDIVASESVSHDVDNLQAERTILEDDLRHFFDTYKVSVFTQGAASVNNRLRATWIAPQFMNSLKGMGGLTCISTTQQLSRTSSGSLNIGSLRTTG